MINFCKFLLISCFLSALSIENLYADFKTAVNVNVQLAGTLDREASILSGGMSGIPIATAPGIVPASTTTFDELNNAAELSSSYEILDSLGVTHSIFVYFFRISNSQYAVRTYVNSTEVDTTLTNFPRQINHSIIEFSESGEMTNSNFRATPVCNWNNGSSSQAIVIKYKNFTNLASSSTITTTDVDNCRFDPSKTMPGTCGCGLPDTDKNSNPILKCQQAPAAPKITIDGNNVTAHYQEFSAPVNYLLSLETVNGRSTKRIKAGNSNFEMTLFKGTWRLRYKVRFIANRLRPSSKHSKWIKFEVQ